MNSASFLPISIIVIGVGGGKFLDMKTLDQDFGLLKVGNEQACRDSVQFVPMRKFLRPAADGSDKVRWSKVALAKEVLAELPDQVTEYMHRNNLEPTKNLKDSSTPQISVQDSVRSLSKDFLQQQKLRRCATAYSNTKASISDRSYRKSSTDGLNPSKYRGTRKCSVDSQFIDDVTRASSQPRNSFSEHHL